MTANYNAIGMKYGSRRPLGVWLLTICHTISAVAGIILLSPGLQEPLPHGWGPDAATAARSQIALLVALLLSAWGTWIGNRRARIALILVLGVTIGISIREDYFAIPYMIAHAEQEPRLWRSLVFWWGATTWLRLILWFVLNYWYLFGGRTRGFFWPSSSGGKQSWTATNRPD